MPAGFLVVFSEPGEQVPLQEFQGWHPSILIPQTASRQLSDWYDNEHVPLRMNHLPSFQTGARFLAIDSLQPSWAAFYDIDDTATFLHESYTRLRVNRSPREADIIWRLELLDRRTCELLHDSGESQLTSSLASRNPTKFVVTHGVSSREGQNFKEWAEKTSCSLKNVIGWVRTRTFKCLDNLKTGIAVVGKGSEMQLVPIIIVMHGISAQTAGSFSLLFCKTESSNAEFQAASVANSEEFTAIIKAPGISEIRSWELYRAYPGVAQGNLE